MNPDIHIVIPIGTASCGKSTYFTALKKKYGINFHVFRISADDIRFQLLDYEHTGKNYDETIEPQVWEMVYHQFMDLLTEKTANTIIIYFDCTNLTIKERSQIIIRALRAKGSKVAIHMVVFTTPLSVALVWNNKRKRNVPEKVIAQQSLRYEPPLAYEYDSITILSYNSETDELGWNFPI